MIQLYIKTLGTEGILRLLKLFYLSQNNSIKSYLTKNPECELCNLETHLKFR